MNQKTPYFVFNEKILKKNFKAFEELCKKYLDKYVIAYSVKTNSFEDLINKLDKLGSSFEAASMEEIIKTTEKFRVFNGPSKTEEELKVAVEKDILINVDNKSEIDKIINLKKDKKCRINLRVSLNDDKFGFENSKINEIIDYCFMNNLEVIGLSFHPGTQVTLKDYENFIKEVEKIVNNINKKIELKYLDLGGGFPDKFQLKNLGVNLEDYFKLISILKKFDAKIILEPGRCLVCDAFDLICKVNVIKNKNGKNYAFLDAGINILSKISMANYKFEKIGDKNDEDKKDKIDFVLAGPLLFGNDIIGKFRGNLKEEDLIKIDNVGAYCYNLGWEISYKKPKIFVGEYGK